MIYYSLDRPDSLDANRIISDISKLLQTTSSQTLQESILVIKLQKITNYSGDSPLPKITYQGECST